MVVTMGASHGGTHPYGHGGVYSVHDGYVSKFLVVGTSLIVGLRVPIEGGGDELVVGGIGE